MKDEVKSLQKDIGNLYDLVSEMSEYLDKRLTQVESHTFKLDDTVARLTLEVNKLMTTQFL